MAFDRERAYKDLKKNLSEKRFKHSLRVAKVAKKLAIIHGVDPKKAELAALFHDFSKECDDTRSLDILNIIGENDRVLLKFPNLAHGQVAAYILKQEYSLEDEEILSAISKHTFGDVNMSKLDRIIYLADAIEPKRDYPKVKKIRKLAKKDLQKACLEYLIANFNYLMLGKKQIAEISLNMYNAELERSLDEF